MAPNTALQAVPERGSMDGFRNLLGKELSLWWSTRRWIKQLLLWTLLLNGTVALLLVQLQNPEPDMGSPMQAALQVFLAMTAIAVSIGAVLSAQDAVIGERQSGTAAWILSKPVSRQAFILTKFLAHAFSVNVLALLVPAALFLPEARLFNGQLPDLAGFASGVGLLVLSVLYYQAMALMLSTLFQSRGAVGGIALAILIGAKSLARLAPWLLKVTPAAIGDIAAAVTMGDPVPMELVYPIIVTALCIPLFLAVAHWRFSREEL